MAMFVVKSIFICKHWSVLTIEHMAMFVVKSIFICKQRSVVCSHQVSSQVGLHVAARGEAFLAHATRERPLSRVCSHMVLKTGVRLKPLTTDGTWLYAFHDFV